MTSSDLVVARDDAPSAWQAIQAQALVLAKSGVVPQAYRGKPDDIVAAALYGRELGWGITTSLSHIHLIMGRPTLSAQGMVGLVRAAGHSIKVMADDEEATAVGKRHDTGDTRQVHWTTAMAKTAGLYDRKDSLWPKYPMAMLNARAVSQLCRDLFADVIMGISYTPEEVLDFIDVDQLAAERSRAVVDERWHTRIDALYQKARLLSEAERDAVRILKVEAGIPVEKPIKDYDEGQVAWLEDVLARTGDIKVIEAVEDAEEVPEAEVDG